MRVTRGQLRQIIREAMEMRRPMIATASDIGRQNEFLEQWSDLLLDELEDRLPNGHMIGEWKESVRARTIEGLRKEVAMFLIGALSTGMPAYTQKRQAAEKDKEAAERHANRFKRSGGRW